jgi:hypothetical protein
MPKLHSSSKSNGKQQIERNEFGTGGWNFKIRFDERGNHPQ